MGDQSSGRGRGVDVVSRSERTGGASGRLRLRRRAPRGLWWLPSYRGMRPDLEGTAVRPEVHKNRRGSSDTALDLYLRSSSQWSRSGLSECNHVTVAGHHLIPV